MYQNKYGTVQQFTKFTPFDCEISLYPVFIAQCVKCPEHAQSIKAEVNEPA